MTTGWRARALKIMFEEKRKEELDLKKQDPAIVASDFCAGLAESDNPEERDKALDYLRVYLPTMTDWSELNVRKIWIGLWAAMWHADRPLVQIEIAQRISRLLNFVKRDRDKKLGIGLPFIWLAGFWKQASEGWPLLDFHRIDKYMKLTRFMLCAGMRAAQESTTTDLDLEFHKQSFLAVMATPHKGLGCHICDIFLDEAERSKLPADILLSFLDAMLSALVVDCLDPDNILVGRLRVAVFSPRLYEEFDVSREAVEQLIIDFKELCDQHQRPKAWAAKILQGLNPKPQFTLPQGSSFSKKYKITEPRRRTKKQKRLLLRKERADKKRGRGSGPDPLEGDGNILTREELSIEDLDDILGDSSASEGSGSDAEEMQGYDDVEGDGHGQGSGKSRKSGKGKARAPAPKSKSKPKSSNKRGRKKK